jgi:microcystin-dependent protein
MAIWDWSLTASSNATADANINWQEGQNPSTVNNSARAMMAALKAGFNDIAGVSALGGSGNTFTLSLSQALPSLTNAVVGFFATRSNTGAVTLNVDSTGAKPLRYVSGVDLTSGEIVDGGFYICAYNTSDEEWMLLRKENTASYATAAQWATLTGAVLPYAGSSAPTGWLLCYGQAVSRSTYPDLFGVIGTTYGTGDGSTTFNLPDMRGRVAAGQDDMGGSSANRLTDQTGGLNGDTLGATGGSETHTLTEAQMPEHDHTASTAITDPGHEHTTTIDYNTSIAAGGAQSAYIRGTAAADDDKASSTETTGITAATTVNNAGSGEAHNNVQPTIILNYIIKT